MGNRFASKSENFSRQFKINFASLIFVKNRIFRGLFFDFRFFRQKKFFFFNSTRRYVKTEKSNTLPNVHLCAKLSTYIISEWRLHSKH